MGGSEQMRVQKATDVWIKRLVNRLIIQLNLPHRLQAKLLYETLQKKTNEAN